jgi:hypothetical protein
MSEGQRPHIKCVFRDKGVPGEQGNNALHRRPRAALVFPGSGGKSPTSLSSPCRLERYPRYPDR